MSRAFAEMMPTVTVPPSPKATVASPAWNGSATALPPPRQAATAAYALRLHHVQQPVVDAKILVKPQGVIQAGNLPERVIETPAVLDQANVHQKCV